MAEVCTIMTDITADIDDESARCRQPAVGRLPGELDFPVCEYHMEMFQPESEAYER